MEKQSQNDVETHMKIRLNLAQIKNESNLPAMNQIIDNLAKEEIEFDFEMMKKTLKISLEIIAEEKQKRHQWILEIMGQILFLLRQNCSIWTFNFMFEMFNLSISTLAGNGQNEIEKLPLNLALFLRKFPDLGPQLAEWMIEVSKNGQISKTTRKLLQNSFLAVKICEGYQEASIWGRLTMSI